jgi:hypothetical protein
MHGWVTWLIAAAAVVAALGVIWRQFLRPLLKLGGLLTDVIPLLEQEVKAFKDVKDPYSILQEIIAQFRSDSGSTLRDSVNRLEESAARLATGAAVDKEYDETARQLAAGARLLAEEDRARLETMGKQLDEITVWMRRQQKAQRAKKVTS